MQLSPHFTLDELTHSQEASRRGINNIPSSEVFANLKRLCVLLLEPLRASLGKQIFISSGYRSPALNEAVGGSKNSDHLRGLAADITCSPLTVSEIALAVYQLAPYVPLKQSIVEFDAWVHVAVQSDTADEMPPLFLMAHLKAGETVYEPWSPA